MQAYRGGHNRDLWDKTWKDKNGNYAIWQTPNWFLIGWAVMTTLSLFVTGRLADIFGWSGLALLVIWSILEITKGVNYFRRFLGLLVLAFAVISFIKTL